MLYRCYLVGRWVVLSLPLKVSYKIAIFAADIYYLFAREDKRCLAENLEIVVGTNNKKLIEKHIKNVFRNFAKYLIDFLRFSVMDEDYIANSVNIIGREHLDNALKKGKGALILTAHIGNWELGGAVVGRLGYPLHAIALEHKDKRINDFFLGQRSVCNMNVIPINARLRSCFKVLLENKFLAIVGDRDFSNTGRYINFFGRKTMLPKGPAVFALKTGAPIIPTSVIRKEDDTFDFTFSEPIEAKPTGDKEKDIENTMKSYIPAMEKFIKAFPDQWYAFRRIWSNEDLRSSTVI